MRPARGVIQAAVVVAGGVYVALFLLQGGEFNGSLYQPVGFALATASIFVVLFDVWLWRVPLLTWLAPRKPYIGGTWRGTLASEWVDPSTGQKVAPDPEVYLVIKQTYWSVSFRLFTRESSSGSLTGVVDSGEGGRVVVGIYRNLPRASVRSRSSMHHGAVFLDVLAKDHLEGFYWTDRQTMGELEFTARRKGSVDGYGEGQRLFQ